MEDRTTNGWCERPGFRLCLNRMDVTSDFHSLSTNLFIYGPTRWCGTLAVSESSAWLMQLTQSDDSGRRMRLCPFQRNSSWGARPSRISGTHWQLCWWLRRRFCWLVVFGSFSMIGRCTVRLPTSTTTTTWQQPKRRPRPSSNQRQSSLFLAGKPRNRFPVFHLLSDPNRFESSFASFSPIRPLRHWPDRRWINWPVAVACQQCADLSAISSRWADSMECKAFKSCCNEWMRCCDESNDLVSEAGHRVADTVTNDRLVTFLVDSWAHRAVGTKLYVLFAQWASHSLIRSQQPYLSICRYMITHIPHRY